MCIMRKKKCRSVEYKVVNHVKLFKCNFVHACLCVCVCVKHVFLFITYAKRTVSLPYIMCCLILMLCCNIYYITTYWKNIKNFFIKIKNKLKFLNLICA